MNKQNLEICNLALQLGNKCILHGWGHTNSIDIEIYEDGWKKDTFPTSNYFFSCGRWEKVAKTNETFEGERITPEQVIIELQALKQEVQA